MIFMRQTLSNIIGVFLALIVIPHGCISLKSSNNLQIQEIQDGFLIVNNNDNNSQKYIGVFKMAKNMRFCKPINDGANLEYAPIILPPKTSAPTEIEYNEAGWYKNEVQPPIVPEGKIVSKTTYVYDEYKNAVFAQYKFEDAPKPIRIFSKLKLYGALTQAGLWNSFEAWLKTQEINGMNAYTAFSLAQDLNDANELFLNMVESAKKDLGVSDEVVKQILEASILDEI